jgi:tungstate transport system permease protein
VNNLPGIWKEAVSIIFSGDREFLGIILRSLAISISAIAAAGLVGVPLGYSLAHPYGEVRRRKGKRAVEILFYSLMAFPTVLMGLVLYTIFSRSGPLGALNLLFTPQIMATGQFFIALPVVVVFSASAVKAVDVRVAETAFALGAGKLKVALTVLVEARSAVGAALAAGFGRAVTEVGCAMIVGGNIRGATRIMSTAIVLETSKGNLDKAIALGFVLLVVAFPVVVVFQILSQRSR